jgi:hypothetical protein
VVDFYANAETSFLCQPCPAGTTSSPERSRCVCRAGWYEYSTTTEVNSSALTAPVVCHETDFGSRPSAPQDEGCIRCGPCLDCVSTAAAVVVSASYIQVFGPDPSMINLFRCTVRTGCFGLSAVDSSQSGCKTCVKRTLPLTTGCQPHYTGHLCGTCVDNYEMRAVRGVTAANAGPAAKFECVPCESATKSEGLAGAVVVSMVIVAALLKDRVFARLTVTRTHLAVFHAYSKSVWQPIRILIT